MFVQGANSRQRSGAVPMAQHASKRQIETDFNYGSNNGRPAAINSASYRQQSSGSGSGGQVPLQQPFRSSAASTKPVNSRQIGVSGGQQRGPQQEQSKTAADSESNSNFQPRANPQSSSFSPPAPSEEIFAPFTAENSKPPSGRPFRQSNSRPFSPVEQRQIGNNKSPEYERGFPDGFTSGLPAFDFQGRMPGQFV